MSRYTFGVSFGMFVGALGLYLWKSDNPVLYLIVAGILFALLGLLQKAQGD